jgi:hypothetical protein
MRRQNDLQGRLYSVHFFGCIVFLWAQRNWKLEAPTSAVVGVQTDLAIRTS